MSSKIDVLVIDDDKFVHKIISKNLSSDSLSVRSALGGKEGLTLISEKIPNIIILDVEMPEMNGYEVCERIREKKSTHRIPIIFLSARSSLQEKMQGYEVGGDDYLIKPFEKEHLLARITILNKFNEERQGLEEQVKEAQKTAMTALTGTSELGQALQFLEKSIIFNNIEELLEGLFDATSRLSLDCAALTFHEGEQAWFSPDIVISPLEKELLETSDKNHRFLDFGKRTIINYPLVSLLVRNMPLEDMELYGRMKDLLPILLSATNVKLGAFQTRKALNQQSTDMLSLFKQIRGNLFQMGETIVGQREKSEQLTSELVQELQTDLFSMGLDEDQEDFLVDKVDNVVEDVRESLNSGAELRYLFDFLLSNLKLIVGRQEELLESFKNSQETESHNEDDNADDDVVLF